MRGRMRLNHVGIGVYVFVLLLFGVVFEPIEPYMLGFEPIEP